MFVTFVESKSARDWSGGNYWGGGRQSDGGFWEETKSHFNEKFSLISVYKKELVRRLIRFGSVGCD